MSSAKEIRTQIKSIQNTQKITKAMELVAASKMRKAQLRMEETRPYAAKIRSVASDLARADTDISHPFLDSERGEERVGYIVISTNRGLCGGLNTNLFRSLLRHMKQYDEDGESKVELAVYGLKGVKYLGGVGANVVASKIQFGDNPKLEELLGPVNIMIQKYIDGDLDRIFLVSNQFVNTMSQKPKVDLLLPVSEDFGTAEQTNHWDFIYEPSAKELIEDLLKRYIEALIRKAVAENIACEMAARMVAMKSATDNAGSLIKDLKLVYNKARQAAITQEISEIVGGAAAV